MKTTKKAAVTPTDKKSARATKTREQFLEGAVRAMDKALLAPAGLRMPEHWTIATSLTTRRKAIGQCHYPQASGDGKTTQLLICPRLSEPLVVMATVLHEMVHAALGAENYGHGKPFADACKAIGLTGKPRHATVEADTPLAAKVLAIAERLGGYPHPGLRLVASGKPSGGGWVRYESVGLDGYKVVVSPKMVEDYGAPRDPKGRAMVPDGQAANVRRAEAREAKRA